MKIGILIDGFVDLVGAADFIIGLISNLRAMPGSHELILIRQRSPTPLDPSNLNRTLRTMVKRIVRPHAVDLRADSARIDELVARIDAGGSPLPLMVAPRGIDAVARFARDRGIDALLPLVAAPPARLALPWVGYLFDFQHRYFPEHFTKKDQGARDAQFARMLNAASTIIVNAREVRRDADRFFAPYNATIFALPFSAAPEREWLLAGGDARAKYGLSRRYFMISNQFWVHKRHDVGILAFADFARTHPDIDLVCTGTPYDYRRPGYVAELKSLILKAGLGDRVHFLGLIPKADQIALMQTCLAVIQPTEFEGGPGGGSVFDAIAIGVRTIVSDIAINREIDDLVTRYFVSGSTASLSAAMNDVADMPPTKAEEATLIRVGETRRRNAGTVLHDALLHSIENYT